MAIVRSALYAAIFYPVTILWVLAGIAASLFGRRPTLAVVLSWVDVHHWLARRILGIRVRVEGEIPPGPHLIAVKHQSMFETLEMVRLSRLPVIVIDAVRTEPNFLTLYAEYNKYVIRRLAVWIDL
jgi:1-acyl-sn-glycerol-3-phosphate acyltransferase